MVNKILDSIDYEYYASVYGVDVIDSAISKMVNAEEKDVFLFDMYLIKELEKLYSNNTDAFSIYKNDMTFIKRFSVSDNIEYTNKIYNVICQLNSMFNDIDVNIKDACYLNDKVEMALEKCSDVLVLNQIKDTYNTYILLRNKLVEGNLNSVLTLVRPFYDDGADMLELVQNSSLGLIIAAEKYNPNYGIPFFKYAIYWIRHFIRVGLRLEMNSVSVPYNYIDSNILRINTIKYLTDVFGREPSYEAIANYSNMDVRRIREVEEACCRSKSLSTDFDVESECLENLDSSLVDDKDIVDIIINEQMKEELISKLSKILTPTEYFVLSKRYGLNDGCGCSYKSIGLLLNKEASSIKWIEKKSLNKVRKKHGDLINYLRR